MKAAESGLKIAIPTHAAMEQQSLNTAAFEIQSMQTAAKEIASIFLSLITDRMQTGKISHIGGEISFSEIPLEAPPEVTQYIREKTGFANQLITEAFLLEINSELAPAGWRATLHNGPTDICRVLVRPLNWNQDLSKQADFIAG